MSIRHVVVRGLMVLALVAAAWPLSGAVPQSPVAANENTAQLPTEAQAAVSTVVGRDDAAYHIVAHESAYQAVNSAQSLDAQFTAQTAQVESGGLRWDMRLQGWGRGHQQAALDQAVLHTADNRIDYRYPGLDEWYINGPYGLQQGFTVHHAPLTASGDPLRLSLDLGGYHAQLDADRKGATLSAPDGSALRYAGLLAYDADGQALTTWLELNDRAGNELHIRVADAGARYPITIDPFVQQAKLIASDAAGDNFGFSVALSSDGSTALIGAYAADVVTKTNQGAAYVFVRGTTTWDLQAKLTADLGTADGHADDRFGIAVALSNDGNTALIGADRVDVSGHTNQGAAYVFSRSGTTWTPQAMLIAADGAADDKMGWSVALSGNGNTALVSAHNATVNTHPGQGAGYVFVRSGSAWSQQGKLTRSTNPDNSYLSYSVALSDDGNTALLGAMGWDHNLGEALTFTRSGSTWTFEDTLLDPFGHADDLFGRSVALSDDGNIALIGASGETVDGKDNQGAAYTFTRSGGNWTLQKYLTANDGAANDYFGVSVALMSNGYVAYVGAYQADVGSYTNQGAVYSFAGSGLNWTQTGKIVAENGYTDNEFGVAVAFSGSTLLVGARGTYNDRGTAHFFVPEGSGTREIKVTGSGNADDRLGIAVALSDSGSLALVGAYRADIDGKVDQGAAYVFRRVHGVWGQYSKLVAPDGAAGDYFGWSVALDGGADTGLVGAHQADVNGKVDAGAAYVFVRNWIGEISLQQKLTGAEVAGDKLGYAVALSDDGTVALCGSVSHASDRGMATFFKRSGTTWSVAQEVSADDGLADDLFGRAVALSIDGSTALIGAAKDDISTKADQGSTYVFVKAGALWSQQAKLTAAEGGAGDRFGTAVALSDDGNTALVGAYLTDVGANTDQGAAYVFDRSGTTWTETEQLVTGSAGSQLGVAVALSADGETALVGAHGANVGGKTDRGAAYVFKHVYAHPLYMWVVQPIITAADGEANDLFGFAVAIDDDGTTLLVGAYGANVAGNSNQGAVYAFIPPYQVYLPTVVR